MSPTTQCQLALRPIQRSCQAFNFPTNMCHRTQRRHESIVGALYNIRSSYNKRIRVGRGPSSGYGKTSGRGHKGQRQHGKVPAGFQGGQTTAEEYAGKRGFVNVHSKEFATVPLTRIQSWIAQGRLAADRPITPRELIISRCVGNAKDGIKLLTTSRSHERSLDVQPPLNIPLNIVVSRASASAIDAVEQAGGKVLTRYYTKWAMDQIVKGNMDPMASMRSASDGTEGEAEEKKYRYRLPDATSRKAIEYYRDANHRGYLAYTVGEHEGPSLFHKPPRHITREEIDEKKRLRGKLGEVMKKTINADDNRIW